MSAAMNRRTAVRIYHNMCRYLLISCIHIALLILLPPSVFSATLSLEHSLGFNGYFRLKSWTPLTLTLENRGRSINGVVEVIVTSGSEYLGNIHQTTYSLDIELPYNAKKLCSFTIRLDTFIHELLIRVRQDENILLEQSVNLRPAYTEKKFIAVVDDKASPEFLAGLPQTFFPVSIRPKFLPETWYGCESVEMMILNTGLLKNLRERQFQALIEWVKQGGYLITTSGINIGALSEQRTEQLLSPKILGNREFIELKALQDFCGSSLISSSPFLVLHVNVESGEVLLQEGDVPLLTQKEMGAGRIMLTAFDFQTPPFSRWSHRHRFWERLLLQKPLSIGQSRIKIDHQSILDALFSHAPANLPNAKLLIFPLVLYLLLLKWLLWRIEKRKGSKGWNMMCLLLTIIVASLMSFGLFFHRTYKHPLLYNSFLSLNLAGQHHVASGEYTVGLYSIRESSYTLQFPAASYPIRPVLSQAFRRDIPDPYRLEETLAGQQVTGALEKWSHNFFRLHTSVELLLSGQAVPDEQGIALLLDNLTPHTVMDCRIYVDNKVFFLGNIPPGKDQRQQISQTDIRQQEFFDDRQAEKIFSNIETHRPGPSGDISFSDRINSVLQALSGEPAAGSFLTAIQKNLAADIFRAVHAQYQSQQDVLCLIGWIPAGFVPMKIDKPGVRGEELTLLTWEIPIKRRN